MEHFFFFVCGIYILSVGVYVLYVWGIYMLHVFMEYMYYVWGIYIIYTWGHI